MKISIVIPTYNGEKKISNILSALEKQSFQDFETIVVIDGSIDNTKAIIEEANFNLKNLKIIERENGGRSKARNTGAKKANGDLLIFFDDDMRPIPECVKLHLKHHHEKTNTILVGPAIEDYSMLKSDFQKFKAYLSRKWGQQLGDKISKEEPFITAANFSISKPLFWKLEGFDERLNDAEDFDLAIKATLKNINIYFKQDIIAWHDDFITAKSYAKRMRQYKKSHDKLKELKPNIYAKFNQYELNKPNFVKKMIYLTFANRFWVWTIDNFNWLKVLPKKLRYKIYDIVMTGYALYR